MVFVTSLSLFSLSGVGSSGFNIPHMDKIVHFTFYFFATVFGSLSYCEVFKVKLAFSSASKKMFLFSVVYGMIIEILQYSITDDRHGDFFDFLANSFGAFLGFLAVKYVLSKRVS